MRNLKKGFSLVELMIVVAIIGILAAIAIPNFVAMQLKAKRAEVPGNVDGIKSAQMAYDAAYDGFVTATVNPTGAIGKAQQDWGTSVTGWSTLGWSPDGKIRGNYATLGAATDFNVEGNSDVDGDGADATYTATKTLNATQTTGNDIY
jgi:type IV pilus assembly protein PilA